MSEPTFKKFPREPEDVKREEELTALFAPYKQGDIISFGRQSIGEIDLDGEWLVTGFGMSRSSTKKPHTPAIGLLRCGVGQNLDRQQDTIYLPIDMFKKMRTALVSTKTP